MPSWFMPMPSDIEIVVNSRGVPPASATPCLAASTWKPCVMLHGVCSPFMLTTPIIGLAIASSSSPMARMKARCGVRLIPYLVMSDLSFAIGSNYSIGPSRERADKIQRRRQGGSGMADKIRLGLIGASVSGTWSARSHLPALRASSDVELTAVCTTRADSAEAARRAWDARLAFDDWRKMVASPEIDAVAVVVRVPSHFAPTKAALEAGKHVYCEWPLGRTTAEAVELAALAKAKGLVTAVGLQARANPALMHMKELVEAGFVGDVMAVHVSLMREGVLSRPSHRTWQRDAELGANTLTIANGHTVDAMRYVTGDFTRLSAVVATQAKQWLDTGTNTWLDVTSPDNVLISGRLANGAVASVHVGAIPFAGSGYRMEIYGRDGTLVSLARILHSWARSPCKRRRGATRSRQCRFRSASRWRHPVHPRAKPSTSVRCTNCSPARSAAEKAVSRPSNRGRIAPPGRRHQTGVG